LAVFGGLRSLAGSGTELALLTFIMGVAAALLPSNVAKVLGAWFPQSELGRANGMVLSAVPLGVSLGLAAGSSVLSVNFGGWRGAIDVFALVCLLMGVGFLLVYPAQRIQPGSKVTVRHLYGHLREVGANRDIWLIAVFSGCFFFVTMSLFGLLPVVLEARGIARAGELASLLMLPALISSPLGGMASDKIGMRKPFLALSAMVMAICIPFFILLTGVPLMAVLVIAGVASGVVLPIMLTTVIEIRSVSASSTATAVGFVMTVGNTIGFVGPVVSGTLIDLTKSPWATFFLLSAVLVIAVGVVVRLPSRDTGS
jgi:cyanate permease